MSLKHDLLLQNERQAYAKWTDACRAVTKWTTIKERERRVYGNKTRQAAKAEALWKLAIETEMDAYARWVACCERLDDAATGGTSNELR